VESRDRVAVGQNFEGLFEAFELFDAHDDNDRNTVSGHDHAIVLFVNAVDDLGEPVLDGRKWSVSAMARIIANGSSTSTASGTCPK